MEEGTVLYTLDSSDANSSLEQSEISLQQAQRSYSRQLEDQAAVSYTHLDVYKRQLLTRVLQTRMVMIKIRLMPLEKAYRPISSK